MDWAARSMAVEQVIGDPRYQQRSGAVHQHDVALSAGLAFQNRRGDFRIARAIAPAQVLDVSLFGRRNPRASSGRNVPRNP